MRLNTKFNSDRRSGKFGADRKEEVAEMEANWLVSKKRLSDLLKEGKGPVHEEASLDEALPKELRYAAKR